MTTEEPPDLTTRVLVEIRDELRGHRTQLVEIRDELRGHRTQLDDIRGELRAQREELTEHRGLLTEHGRQFREHEAQLRGIATTVTRVLRAVEHGNELRDQRVFDHEARITRLEERTGIGV